MSRQTVGARKQWRKVWHLLFTSCFHPLGKPSKTKKNAYFRNCSEKGGRGLPKPKLWKYLIQTIEFQSSLGGGGVWGKLEQLRKYAVFFFKASIPYLDWLDQGVIPLFSGKTCNIICKNILKWFKYCLFVCFNMVKGWRLNGGFSIYYHCSSFIEEVIFALKVNPTCRQYQGLPWSFILIMKYLQSKNIDSTSVTC